MNIGENIKKYRKANKMTQKDLASAIGLTAPTITKYENGQLSPDIKIVMKISEVLGVSLHDILGIDLEIDCRESDAINMLEELLYVLGYIPTYEPSCSSQNVTINYNDISVTVNRSEFESLQEDIIEFIRFKVESFIKKNEPTYS